MKQLFLFGWTVLLFILCCPGVLLEPYKYKNIGILLHCVVFTILYFILYNHMSSVIEGLETTTDKNKKFEETKTKLFNEIKTIQSSDETHDTQAKKVQEIFEKIFSDWEEKDIQAFQTKYDDFFKKELNMDDEVTLEYVLNEASPEKIKLIDSLSQKQQNALEKICLSLDQDEINKILKLDNEKFKEILTKIINNQ